MIAVLASPNSFFAYGLGNGLYFPFAVGASTVLLSGRQSRLQFRRLCHNKAQPFFQRADLLCGDADRTKDNDERLASVRQGISAGEALPGTVWKNFKDRLASRFWTASAQPKSCTSSFPIGRERSNPAAPEKLCPATRPGSLMTQARMSRQRGGATSDQRRQHRRVLLE